MIGFTRLEPPTMDAQGEIDLDVELSPLTLRRTWLPATEVWGEGVFIAPWVARPDTFPPARSHIFPM